MKRLIAIVGLLVCVFALVAGASAQENLTFADLPSVSVPSPMPNGYGQLQWENFFYVNPTGDAGAGLGYQLGPANRDVVFIGAKSCRLVGYTCYGTLSNAQGFQLVSMTAAAGSKPTLITVTAYNNGKFIGSSNFLLSYQLENTLTFPDWGIVTEVVIQVSSGADDFVLYNMSVYTLGG